MLILKDNVMRHFPRNILSSTTLSQQSTNYSNMLCDFEKALQLRNMAIAAGLDCPKYLLAPEIQLLLTMLSDFRQLMLIKTLWNTGARINEALALTKGDFYLEGDKPFVVLRTLKQRKRAAGRPREGEIIKRAVPLFDPLYVHDLQTYFTSFKLKRDTLLWNMSSTNTARNWINQAVAQARTQGHVFFEGISCHTFRHSFAMHLLFHRIPLKVIQAYLGHERSSSTEIYTRIFTLDIVEEHPIHFL